MDEIDQKLIRLFQEDGRRSFKAVAKDLGISQATAQWRIKKLIKEEVLRFSVQINPNVFSSPIALIVALKVTQREFANVRQRLVEHPNISLVMDSTGCFNLFVLALFSNFEAVSDFILYTGEGMKGIRKAEVFPLLHFKHKSRPVISFTVDSLDRKLIELLSLDGRQSSVTLAKILDTNPTTIQRRLRNLINEGIVRIFAAVDDTKTNWYWLAIIGVKVDHNNILHVLETIKDMAGCRFASCTFGSYSVIALIDGASRSELHDKVEEKIAQLNGVVEADIFISEGVTFCPIKIGD